MIISAIFASLHFIIIFVMAICLFIQWQNFDKNITFQAARKIQRADFYYGIAAGLIIVIGLLRVFLFEKGSGYYFSNPLFNLKLIAFIVVAASATYPAYYFTTWNAQTKVNKAPEIDDKQYKNISRFLKIEIVGFIIIIFASSMAAKGIGVN